MKPKCCPFCGDEKIEDWGDSILGSVRKWMYCTECLSRGPSVRLARDEDEGAWLERAIEAWNDRTPEAAQ